jgi:hypothetical protein
VRIDRHTRAQRFRSYVPAPTLRICDEEPLFRREAFDSGFRTPVALERPLERVIRGEQPAEVGDVLAERQFPIHVEGVHLDVLVELVDDLLRFARELE